MSRSTRCIGEPLSWLALERYQLGELAPRRSRSVARHLQRCDACRECFERIEAESATVTLPPLPVLATGGAAPAADQRSEAPGDARQAGRAGQGRGETDRRRRSTSEGRPSSSWVRWLAPVLAASAVAAAALVIVLRPPDGPPGEEPLRSPGRPRQRIAYKGGELALALVRERDGRIEHQPRSFAPGDRFKALVTCPPPGRLRWDLVVFQDGQRYRPLRYAGPLACGNRVVLPGAFQLDGRAPAEVCLLIGPRRGAIAARRARDLEPGAVCIALRRAPTR